MDGRRPPATGGQGELSRSMGVGIATLTLIGYVVGPAIFILPGELAVQTGPALYIAYALAAIPAIFACLVTAELGSLFPFSGASYVAVSRVLSPFWGFLLVWTVILSVGVGVPVLAYGFSQYVRFFWPQADPLGVALAVVAFFTVVNLLGVRLSRWLQAAMVIEVLGALLFFILGGTLHGDPVPAGSLMPFGFGAVAMAAVPAYLSYTGFMVLAEISGEVRDPARTVPRSLAWALAAIFLIYVTVPYVVTRLLPLSQLGPGIPAVGRAAEVFLPQWLANLISLSALLAAASSINGVLLIQSRDVLAMARDRVLPPGLAWIHPRHGSPTLAVLFLGALSTAGVLLGQSITEYAIMTVLGFMLIQILVAAAMWLAPARLPERLAASPWHFSRRARRFYNGGLIALSLLFMVVGIAYSPVSTLIYLLLVALGGAYYLWRRRALQRSGLDLNQALKTLEPGELSKRTDGGRGATEPPVPG